MDQAIQWFQHLAIPFSIGIVAVIIAGCVLVFLVINRRRTKLPPKTDKLEDLSVFLNIDEIRKEAEEQESDKRWFGRMNFSLQLAQGLVGAVMTSSVVHDSITIPKQATGVLGLLVLAATLMHQLIRPDLKRQCAQGRATALRSLLRVAQQEIALIERSGAEDYPRIERLCRLVRGSMDRIDQSYVDEQQGIVSKIQLPSLGARDDDNAQKAAPLGLDVRIERPTTPTPPRVETDASQQIQIPPT
jgi:hypothetical protein